VTSLKYATAGSRHKLAGKPKKTEEEWFQAGLETLRRKGPDGLKIKGLAVALGVTTGSFYWHFKNVREFHRKLLEYWIDWDTKQTIREARENENPMQRIETLVEQKKLSVYGDAIHRWALVNEEAAQAMERADKLRHLYMSKLLVGMGLDESTASVRAQMIVWMVSGYRSADEAWRLEVLKELMDLVSPPDANT
jgi:AcrR family transcriptional regulator